MEVATKGYNRMIYVQEICFLLVTCFVIFNNIPSSYKFLTALGVFDNKLGTYPIIVGTFLGVILEVKTKKFFVKIAIFKKYFIAYILIMLLSLLVGLYKYPYYNELIPSQSFLNFISFFEKNNIKYSFNSVMGAWLFLGLLNLYF